MLDFKQITAFLLLSRDVSCKVYLRKNPQILSKISLPSPFLLRRDKLSRYIRVVTIYPSAAAQIAMAGQAKGLDFQKN